MGIVTRGTEEWISRLILSLFILTSRYIDVCVEVQCMLSKLYGLPTIVWPVYDANSWVCLFGQTVGIPVGLYTFIY